jgi:hypothetical protein
MQAEVKVGVEKEEEEMEETVKEVMVVVMEVAVMEEVVLEVVTEEEKAEAVTGGETVDLESPRCETVVSSCPNRCSYSTVDETPSH